MPELTSLPKLTRTMALEITPCVAKNAKRVAGEILEMSAFAHVGDAKRKSTWKLPLKFKDAASSKRAIRKAIATLAQAELSAEEQAKAWKRIAAAARSNGIALEDENDPKKSGEAELQRLAAERAERKAKRDPQDGDEADELDEDEEDEPNDDDERSEEDDDGADDDRFEMSFSSETPVPRWFGDEILDHSAGCVDMTRAASGLAYLVDHDTGDQVGIIEDLQLQKKKLRGTVRFSRSQRAQDIKRDVQDGIRPFVSIGYRINEVVLESEKKDDNGVHRTYRVTNWTPMEGSTVSVPADVSVGVGRASAGSEEFPVSIRSASTAGDKNSRSAAGVGTQQIHTEVRKNMDPKQAAEILRLCTTHGLDSARAAELIEREGMNVDIAAREILADVTNRNNGDKSHLSTPAAENSGKMLELTEREQKSYQICRGVLAKVREAETGKRDNCFELEVSEEIEKRHEGKKHGGIFVPYNLGVDPAAAARGEELATGKRTVLTTGGSTTGQKLVFTEPGTFIQFLYNRMRLKELGAETVSGLVGNVSYPKQTGKASGSWVAENPGSDVADSNMTIGQVLTSPKTYQSSSAYSRQLLAQAVIDIDNLVRTDLARDCALAIDKAGISGSGSANDPTGILSTSGVQAYTMAADSANGGVPQYSDIIAMQELLEEANADQVGDFGWLTTPGVKAVLRRTPVLVYTPPGASTTVNVSGEPVWSRDSEVDGYMARSSNQVPSNLTKGTAAGICHALILGVFSALINGLWGSGFELVVDPYRLKKQGIIELTTFVMTDWANRYPAAFVAAQDCLKS